MIYVVLTSSDEKLTYLDEVSEADDVCLDELLPQLTDGNEFPSKDRLLTHWFLVRLPELECAIAIRRSVA